MWWYVLQVAAAPWWLPVNNSDWKHPVGPGSSIDNMSVSLCVQYVVTSYVHSYDIVYLTTSLNLLLVGGVEIFSGPLFIFSSQQNSKCSENIYSTSQFTEYFVIVHCSEHCKNKCKELGKSPLPI